MKAIFEEYESLTARLAKIERILLDAPTTEPGPAVTLELLPVEEE